MFIARPKHGLWDDASGKPLDCDKVIQTCHEELKEVRRSDLHTKVPTKKCYDVIGKALKTTRWVDINKGGDSVNPEYRSRIVGRELKKKDIYRDDLFAATPPLEATKLLFSFATTEGIGHPKGKPNKGIKIEFIDVRRAYYQAKAQRDLYVQLPGGDREEGMYGRLNKALQGIRDAGQCWEYEYNKLMREAGFSRGICSPCVFYHKKT